MQTLFCRGQFFSTSQILPKPPRQFFSALRFCLNLPDNFCRPPRFCGNHYHQPAACNSITSAFLMSLNNEKERLRTLMHSDMWWMMALGFARLCPANLISWPWLSAFVCLYLYLYFVFVFQLVFRLCASLSGQLSFLTMIIEDRSANKFIASGSY